MISTASPHIYSINATGVVYNVKFHYLLHTFIPLCPVGPVYVWGHFLPTLGPHYKQSWRLEGETSCTLSARVCPCLIVDFSPSQNCSSRPDSPLQQPAIHPCERTLTPVRVVGASNHLWSVWRHTRLQIRTHMSHTCHGRYNYWGSGCGVTCIHKSRWVVQ